MSVDVADAQPVQLVTLDQGQDLLRGGDRRRRKRVQETDDLPTPGDSPESP